MYNWCPQKNFIPTMIPIPRYQYTPFAKSYIMFQHFDRLFPLEEGFHKGTIFPELYIPYDSDKVKGGMCK